MKNVINKKKLGRLEFYFLSIVDGNDRKIEYSKLSSAVHEVFHLNERLFMRKGTEKIQ